MPGDDRSAFRIQIPELICGEMTLHPLKPAQCGLETASHSAQFGFGPIGRMTLTFAVRGHARIAVFPFAEAEVGDVMRIQCRIQIEKFA